MIHDSLLSIHPMDDEQACDQTPDQPGQPEVEPDGFGLDELPCIQVNDRQLREIVADAWNAVSVANTKPFLFQRSGQLVGLDRDERGMKIIPIGRKQVYSILIRVADWIKVTAGRTTESNPPNKIDVDMTLLPDPRLPHLENVLNTPAYSTTGQLITRPGYHPQERLWYGPAKGFNALEVPTCPSPKEVTAARSFVLEELLADFPFTTDSDRAHAVSALLLPFARQMINGCTPLHVVDAFTPGSGKGLLCNVISLVTTGVSCTARTIPSGDDEIRKMLTAELSSGRSIVLLDNAREYQMIDSSSLAVVLTTPSWTDRVLGSSQMVTLPNRAMWLLTGNNVQLSSEMVRRCARIQIDTRNRQPGDKFRHPDLLCWVHEHRSRLVQAALVLVQAWIAADQPMGPIRMGSFEQWSQVMGGILQVAGIDGFLVNQNAFHTQADAEKMMWLYFIQYWLGTFGTRHVTAGNLNELCQQMELMLPKLGGGSERSQQNRMAATLQRAVGRIYNNWRIMRVAKVGHHSVHYFLQNAAPPKSQPVAPCPENSSQSLK